MLRFKLRQDVNIAVLQDPPPLPCTVCNPRFRSKSRVEQHDSGGAWVVVFKLLVDSKGGGEPRPFRAYTR